MTSGLLTREMFGAPVGVTRTGEGRIVAGVETRNINGDVVKVDTSGDGVYRRSIYMQMRRNGPATVLDTFDLPVMAPNCESRACSTVATQSLFLMNDEFVLRAAKALAARLRAEAPGELAAQTRRLWVLTQGKPPTASEQDNFLRVLSEQTTQMREYFTNHPPAKNMPTADPELEAFGSLCQALLVSNRFLYLE